MSCWKTPICNHIFEWHSYFLPHFVECCLEFVFPFLRMSRKWQPCWNELGNELRSLSKHDTYLRVHNRQWNAWALNGRPSSFPTQACPASLKIGIPVYLFVRMSERMTFQNVSDFLECTFGYAMPEYSLGGLLLFPPKSVRRRFELASLFVRWLVRMSGRMEWHRRTEKTRPTGRPKIRATNRMGMTDKRVLNPKMHRKGKKKKKKKMNKWS